MSFDEKMAALIQCLPKLVEHLETEEATKNALIMPFISALGYDVFNPQEVMPEFTADVGIKKGEKVDYAIKYNGEIVLLFECKKAGVDLNQEHMTQLFRYFSVTKARIAVLTNGLQYRFFSDLEEPNKLDARPFLELDLEIPRPRDLQEVKKLAKGEFNLDEILNAASELKLTSAVKKILTAQYESPEEDFVRFFFVRANPGAKFVATAKEQFTAIVTKAFHQFVSEWAKGRLEPGPLIPPDGDSQEQTKDETASCEEELEGFRIVRAIACQVISPDRLAYRNHKSYMGILLDDNNRKPICRLRFNTRQKYLGVFDADKKETKISIESLMDIYKHGEQLNRTIQNYED